MSTKNYKSRAELQEEIEKLKEQLSQTSARAEQEYEDVDIPLTRYIRVMSLCPNRLNLATASKKGRYSFDEFGDMQRIMYKDVVEVIEENRSFLEGGLFYIMDKDVIRAHGLNDVYDTILRKETIEALLDGRLKNGVELFLSTTQKQREEIARMLIAKLLSGASIDMNFVRDIETKSGIKITDRVAAAREFEAEGSAA